MILDIKIPIEDKTRLSGVEIGISYYLIEAGFDIFDAGEDYAVWIKVLKEESIEDAYRLTINISITQPTILFQKKLILKEDTIIIDIPIAERKELNTSDSFTKFAKGRIENINEQKILEGKFGGKAVAERIMQMLKE